MSRPIHRYAYGTIAVAVAVAIVLQIPLTATNTDNFFTTRPARVFNLFFYFTIVMNILVAVVSVRLLISPTQRSSRFAPMWVAALVGIAITGVVYQVMLAAEATNEGAAVFTNFIFHVAVPVAVIGAWLTMGPRGLIDTRTIAWSTAVPLAWLAVTLLRGELTDGYYPYPFLDVGLYGYGAIVVNVAGIAVAYLGFAALAMAVDRRLARRATT
jgi:hypothetical protein